MLQHGQEVVVKNGDNTLKAIVQDPREMDGQIKVSFLRANRFRRTYRMITIRVRVENILEVL